MVSRRRDAQAALVGAAGAMLAGAGATTWWLVRSQLLNEKITVEKDATHFAGARVAGPLTAFYQADVIGRNALKSSHGKAYAELPAGDPAGKTLLTASFLRASLYTSVMAFGVATLTAGLGLILLVISAGLRRAERRASGR